MGRYKLPPVLGPRIRTYEARTFQVPFPPTRHQDAAFISMTIQLANKRVEPLIYWVRREIRDNDGCPPVIYVDEAQTGSVDNEWGNTARALREAGAITVFLTGTPYRADNKRIEGFKFIEEQVKPVSIGRRRDGEDGEQLVDIYEGQRTMIRLDPDYEYSLRKSWDVDNPPVLRKLNRIPLDFDLDTLDPVTDEKKGSAVLSELATNKLHGKLSEILRQDKVIKRFCEELSVQLQNRKNDVSDAAAIVFVGNDRLEEDGDDNYCARRFVELLGEADSNLKCVIATSAGSSEGLKALRSFQDGKGDVLVVKQMGAIGYDVPRLEVEVDLSSTRKATPFVQKIGRVLRVRRVSDDPREDRVTATYITPADAVGAGLWQQFIAGQHGETSLTNVEYAKTVLAKEPGPPREVYQVTNPRDADYYSDSDFQVSPMESLPMVDRVVKAVPALERIMTLPSVEKVLPALRNALDIEEDGKEPQASTNGHTTASVVDGNAEQKDDQGDINRLAREVATTILGRPYSPGDKVFGPKVAEVMYKAKKRCGIPNKKPENYTQADVVALKTQLAQTLEMYQ